MITYFQKYPATGYTDQFDKRVLLKYKNTLEHHSNLTKKINIK